MGTNHETQSTKINPTAYDSNQLRGAPLVIYSCQWYFRPNAMLNGMGHSRKKREVPPPLSTRAGTYEAPGKPIQTRGHRSTCSWETKGRSHALQICPSSALAEMMERVGKVAGSDRSRQGSSFFPFETTRFVGLIMASAGDIVRCLRTYVLYQAKAPVFFLLGNTPLCSLRIFFWVCELAIRRSAVVQWLLTKKKKRETRLPSSPRLTRGNSGLSRAAIFRTCAGEIAPSDHPPSWGSACSAN